MREEQTATNPPGTYDTVSKTLLHEYPEDLVAFGLGTSDVEVLEVVETEQPRVHSHQADSFIRVRVGGEDAIVHIEVQTREGRNPPMPYRMLGYIVRAVQDFQLPVYSHVIYLAPGAGRNDPGEYLQNISGYPIHIGYKVIRLSELEGELFLESGAKGLLPFTPLMRPPAGVDAESWLDRCLEVADTASEGLTNRAEFITGLAIFSGLVYDEDVIVKALSFLEGIDVQESTFARYLLRQGVERGVQQGREEGLQQGERASLIESILENLEFRFEGSDLQTVASQLAPIEDIDRLKQLRLAALQSPSFAAFQDIITSNGSSD